MSDKYTLTVKFAPPGTKYLDENGRDIGKKSTWGHVWLETRSPGASEPESFGWAAADWMDKTDNFKEDDWMRYQGKDISSITIEITKAQYEQMQVFGQMVKSGKVPGFSAYYNPTADSCIDMAGRGISHIGLADKNFDGSAVFWARPDKQVNAFLEQIVKHRPQGADLVVEHRGRTYVFGENERGVEKFWKTVDPYWYLGENERQQQNSEHPQYAHTHSLGSDDMFRNTALTTHAEAIMANGRECFTKFCDYYDIYYPKDKLDNIVAAMAAYGRAEDMRDVSKIDVDGDSVLIGHYQPD